MKKLTQQEIARLDDMAYDIRKKSTEMVIAAKWGHLGGVFSLAELLAVLYGKVLDIDPANPYKDRRDYFVLSKAHSSPALYTALALRGIISEEDLFTYCRIGGLEGHLDALNTRGVEVTGGSLGLGVSYSVGLAVGLRQKGYYMNRVYCVVGDGELSEGQLWEAVMSAGHFQLDNLILIVDYNKVMAKGFVYQQMNQEPLRDRFESFGWNVLDVDGHDVEDIYAGLYRAKHIMVTGRPICVLLHSVKGYGVHDCEFNFKWHTHAPGVEEGNRFLKELAQRYGKPYKVFTPPADDRPYHTLQNVMEGADRR